MLLLVALLPRPLQLAGHAPDGSVDIAQLAGQSQAQHIRFEAGGVGEGRLLIQRERPVFGPVAGQEGGGVEQVGGVDLAVDQRQQHPLHVGGGAACRFHLERQHRVHPRLPLPVAERGFEAGDHPRGVFLLVQPQHQVGDIARVGLVGAEELLPALFGGEIARGSEGEGGPPGTVGLRGNCRGGRSGFLGLAKQHGRLSLEGLSLPCVHR